MNIIVTANYVVTLERKVMFTLLVLSLIINNIYDKSSNKKSLRDDITFPMQHT